jgi:Na+-translocating ferredoxin:NAD+ oxidoreductase RnfG subunit
MNIKRIALLSVMMICGLVFLAQAGFSSTLLTKDQALNEVLGKPDSTTVKKITLTKADKEKIKAKLDNRRILIRSKYQVIFGTKDKKPAGAAMIVTQPGKWGMIEFMVGLDANTAKVKRVVVMKSREKRGRQITKDNFLNEFIGKTPSNNLILDQDIDGISGATISARAAAHAVREAMVVYETMVLKK